MFVMVGVWRETSVRAPVRVRMEETLSKAAVSITLTSLTDCLAFGVGCISPFRSVRFFCAYAGESILLRCVRVVMMISCMRDDRTMQACARVYKKNYNSVDE